MKKKVEVWYNEQLDVLCIVEPNGKIYKYRGSFCEPETEKLLNLVNGSNPNEWHRANVHPEYSYDFIGEL